MSARGAAARTIVFVGLCQAEFFARIHRRHIAPLRDERTAFVSLNPWRPEPQLAGKLASIAAADVVVEQVFDGASRIPRDLLRPSVPWLRFPYLSAAFLWPFNTGPHPENFIPPWLPHGPYGIDMGDAVLNRMIADKVPPAEAARRYLDMDVVRAGRAERLMELHLHQQRRRDEASDMRTADFIAAHLRTTQLFWTKGNPSLAALHLVAAQLFAALDVPPDIAATALGALLAAGHLLSEAPIHPRLAAHFGLAFAGPDRRYRFLNEGRFSFSEFVERYMVFAWVPELHEGIVLARRGDAARALSLLRAGLALCPASSTGWRELGRLLTRLGQQDQARAALDRALSLDPDDADTTASLARLELREENVEGAGRLARRAVDLAPFAPGGHHALTDYLAACGQARPAADAALRLVALDPADLSATAKASRLLLRAGDAPAAERMLQAALRQSPDDEPLLVACADVLMATDRTLDALPPAERLVVLRPADARHQARLGTMLLRLGDLNAAEQALRAAVALDPALLPARHALVDLLENTRRRVEAIALLAEAGAADPHVLGKLGILRARAGDLRGAEAALRHAVALAPALDYLHVNLADVVARTGLHSEAIALLRAAAAATGGSPKLTAKLARLLHDRTR